MVCTNSQDSRIVTIAQRDAERGLCRIAVLEAAKLGDDGAETCKRGKAGEQQQNQRTFVLLGGAFTQAADVAAARHRIR